MLTMTRVIAVGAVCAIVSLPVMAQGPMTIRSDGLEFPDGSVQTTAAAALSQPLFYLTDANVATNQALTACAPGFHMASFWEIVDPSNLTYAFDHPDAHTKSDSGYGPPSGWYGWVRTGNDSSTFDAAGQGNCATWTSTSPDSYGPSVRLPLSWETPPGEIGNIWDSESFSCSFTGPVWCVQDRYTGGGFPAAETATEKAYSPWGTANSINSPSNRDSSDNSVR